MPVITHIDEYHIEIEISDEMLEEESRKNRDMRYSALTNHTSPKIPDKQTCTGRDELRGRMPHPLVQRQRPHEEYCPMTPNRSTISDYSRGLDICYNTI